MDNTEKTLANGDTEAPITKEVQVEETVKTYTQDEVDNMMARMKGSISKKLLKPDEDLGDPEELRKLKAEAGALQISSKNIKLTHLY